MPLHAQPNISWFTKIRDTSFQPQMSICLRMWLLQTTQIGMADAIGHSSATSGENVRYKLFKADEIDHEKCLRSRSATVQLINQPERTIIVKAIPYIPWSHSSTFLWQIALPGSGRVLIALCLGFGWCLNTPGVKASEPKIEFSLTNSLSESPWFADHPIGEIWRNGIGEGFSSAANSISWEAGSAAGLAILGGHQRHDLALTAISYGHMLGPVCGEDHWYRGNWELRGELFGGVQFSPSGNYVIGLTPHLRYDFATGTRWVPFLDAGAGVSATGIGTPDLSGTFEFNLQGAAGVHWFIRDNLAITAEARYLHFSCAGMSSPNLGLNAVAGMIGLSWFF